MTTHKQSIKEFHCTCRDWSQDICPGCKINRRNTSSLSRESTENWEEEVSTSDFLFWDEDCKQNFLDRAKLRNYVKSLLLQERQRAAEVAREYVSNMPNKVNYAEDLCFADESKLLEAKILNPETN